MSSMDACSAVERELEKVLSKFDGLHNNTDKIIEEQIANIEKLQRDIADSDDGSAHLSALQAALVKQASHKVSDNVAKVATDHRDLHSSVSKVGKVIDRNFSSDFDATYREDVFSGPTKEGLLNEVILQHLYRHGQVDISQSLAAEANIPEFEAVRESEPFLEVNRILAGLKAGCLEPALEWAASNRENLNRRTGVAKLSISLGDNRPTVHQRSSLELKLHKLKFVDLLQRGNRLEAIKYARLNFPKFVDGQEREVQSLMGAVMYAGAGLAESPYGHLLDPAHWAEIGDLFLRDACALLGLSVESPLTVAVNAGCRALPALLNLKQVMVARHVPGVWNTGKEELPIEIDLDGDSRYHSVFACPILRQQVTDNNPPMRLTCGHVISREALGKLSQGHKLKCPYCPVEQNPNDSRQIFF